MYLLGGLSISSSQGEKVPEFFVVFVNQLHRDCFDLDHFESLSLVKQQDTGFFLCSLGGRVGMMDERSSEAI